MTKVVNFFAGPGAGKSTCATGCFAALKRKTINCEYVSEYAKELTWKRSFDTLQDQFHVFGEQHLRQSSMIGKVEFLLTDSPLILSHVYADRNYPQSFHDTVMWAFKQYDNVNFFVKRRATFNQEGRKHTLEQSIEKDSEIELLLIENNIPFDVIYTDGDHVAQVLGRLGV